MVADSTGKSSLNLKVLLVLSFGHLATDMCQSALPAILPFLKAKLLLSYAMSGLILVASNVTSSVIQPLFGYLSDKREKAFLLPLGCLCAGLGLSLVTFPNHYVLVLLSVVVSGLGIAAYHPEGFKTARSFTGDRLAMGLSVFTVGGNVGLALGPVATIFIVTRFGIDYLPLMLVFSFAFLSLLLSIRSSLKQARPITSSQGTAAVPAPPGAYLSMGLLVAAVVMRSWTHFGMMTYIPFYYIDHEKGDPLYAGTLVTAFLAGGAVGTLLGSPLADRFGYKRYLIMSLLMTGVLFPLIFVTHGLLLILTLAIVGMALISSFTSTIVMAQEILPGNLGVASGLMAGFAIGTGGIGVALLGVIADHFGLLTTLHCIGFLPVAGVLIGLLIRFPLRRRPQPQPA